VPFVYLFYQFKIANTHGCFELLNVELTLSVLLSVPSEKVATFFLRQQMTGLSAGTL
jgi:hypothetical protein